MSRVNRRVHQAWRRARTHGRWVYLISVDFESSPPVGEAHAVAATTPKSTVLDEKGVLVRRRRAVRVPGLGIPVIPKKGDRVVFDTGTVAGLSPEDLALHGSRIVGISEEASGDQVATYHLELDS